MGVLLTAIDSTVAAGPRAPKEARGLLGDLPLDEDLRANVELIISELVSNSVLHGGGPEGRDLRLRIRARGRCVKGEVCDHGAPTFGWQRHEPDLSEPGGLGLMIVDQLAARWGITENEAACVWFECSYRD
jgi:anti-sigma regulatory factor (Ser/Thr protein kinase)